MGGEQVPDNEGSLRTRRRPARRRRGPRADRGGRAAGRRHPRRDRRRARRARPRRRRRSTTSTRRSRSSTSTSSRRATRGDVTDASRRARSRPTRCSSSSRTSAGCSLLTGRPGGRAREAHRARRPPRQAGDGRGQPAPRRLDREELPQPGPAVPRPDPGGDDRPRARGREVRLPQGLQVLDVRHLVDPPGGRARARRQGADDPHAGARGREAEQDRPPERKLRRGARPRADARRDRRATSSSRSTRSSRSRARAQAPISLEKPVGDEEESKFGDFLADQHGAAPGGGRRDHAPPRGAARDARHALATASAACSSSATASTASPRTLDEVGRAFNVTRERIRQIENQSLRKLQSLPAAARLRGVA